MSEIEDNIKRFIYATFPLAKKRGIENEASLLESGIVDSLGILEIVNYLVESHGINIDEDDLIPDNFNSIRSIAELILKKREDFSN